MSAFLNNLDAALWNALLLEFFDDLTRKIELYEFKEELWDVVTDVGEAVRMGTGLDPDAREVLPNKIKELREG